MAPEAWLNLEQEARRRFGEAGDCGLQVGVLGLKGPAVASLGRGHREQKTGPGSPLAGFARVNTRCRKPDLLQEPA